MTTDHKHEKLLAIFYPLIIACGFVCSVTTAVVWNHWKYVLDTCVEWNCGCILNGISTLSYFNGGHVAYCHWATFGLILSMVVAIVFGIYHVYRVCMSSGKNRRGQHSVRQKSGDIIVMTTRSEVSGSSSGYNGVSPYYWIPASIASGFMIVYTLVHAIMLLIGFLNSCRQYRTEMIKYMRAGGSVVAAIQGRVSCTAVFDFMDYIHPDFSFDRRRIDRINSSACLVLALITAWGTVVLWIAVFVINVIQARRSRGLRV